MMWTEPIRPLRTTGGDTFQSVQIQLAGGQNMAEELQG